MTPDYGQMTKEQPDILSQSRILLSVLTETSASESEDEEDSDTCLLMLTYVENVLYLLAE